MNKILLFLATLIILSCNPNSEVQIDNKTKETETQSYIPVNKETKYVATSQGALDGKIIINSREPFFTAMEYDSLKNLLTTILTSGKTKLVTHFDKEGNEIKMTSHESGVLNVFQENKYNERGDLFEELRVDKNQAIYDTVFYKYNYKYSGSSEDYTMTRTNNGEPVTHYTVKYGKNKIFKSEQAHPNDRFYLLRQYETTVNKSGDPLEIIQTSIFKDQGETNHDTTVSKTVFQYNESGLVISEINTDHGLKPNSIFSKYKDDLISEKKIGNQTIRFNHLEID